jgi:hypothetical protein
LGKFLQSGPPQTADVAELKLNLEQMQQINAQLTKENEELKQRVRMNDTTFYPATYIIILTKFFSSNFSFNNMSQQEMTKW